MGFTLSTDTSCDILRSELRSRGIEYRPLVYTIDDVPYFDEFTRDEDYKGFYEKVRAGKMPTTSQINIAEHEEFFRSLVQKYEGDIVHITLSGGLSSTYDSACKAAENVNSECGCKRVYVVDSLGATVVSRIVVDEAEKYRDEGLNAETAVEKLKEFIAHVHVWFMTTDLMHLKRGGRVSGAAAVIGTALSIKPILVINKTGGLSIVAKKIGAGKGMAYMLDMFERYSADCTSNSKVYIPSADSEYAQPFAEKVKALRPDCDVEIGWVGPVIGAHTGAGLVGVCMLSDKVREA